MLAEDVRMAAKERVAVSGEVARAFRTPFSKHHTFSFNISEDLLLAVGSLVRNSREQSTGAKCGASGGFAISRKRCCAGVITTAGAECDNELSN